MEGGVGSSYSVMHDIHTSVSKRFMGLLGWEHQEQSRSSLEPLCPRNPGLLVYADCQVLGDHVMLNELIGEGAVLLIHSRQLKDTIFTVTSYSQ